MINTIRNNSEKICKKNFREMGLFLVRFNGLEGIVRCRHTEKENTINLLKKINKINDEKVTIETIATSGTIKALIKKHMPNSEI
jgi:RNase P/RNase MRP subunit POP5